MDFRVGLGQDSHRFSGSGVKGLVIGGVLMEDEVKLEGNSDADVVLHAVFNAISSAMGGRSISLTADTMCLDQGVTDSKEYIKVLIKEMNDAGYKVSNLSLSIECKNPKIEPVVGKMTNVIAQLIETSEDRIGITATSGEGLSSFGKGEGIQCLVTVSLVR